MDVFTVKVALVGSGRNEHAGRQAGPPPLLLERRDSRTTCGSWRA